MNRDDIQKLLGGYATGTLTPEEQRALFEAALTDQELFDALAREEALRDVLSDGAARAYLLAAMNSAPSPWYRAWWRPMVVMAAALVVVIGVAVWERSREPKPVQVAKVDRPRFQPAAATPNAAPRELPPPPEVKSARPAAKPLPLPEAPAATPASRPLNGRSLAVPLAVPPPQPSGEPRFQPARQPQQGQEQDRLQQVPAPATSLPFLAQPSVQIHGTVTDSTGAAVPSAQIVIKSLSSDLVVHTSTNERGEFTASEIRGFTYDVSASKAGFATATVKDIPPLDGAPAPVSITLNGASTAESVEVSESSAQLQPLKAAEGGGGFAGAVSGGMKKAAATQPAASYQLLRVVPAIGRVPVTPGATVPAGSSLTLRVTPAGNGSLRIVEGKRTVGNAQVTQGIVSEMPLPSLDKRGRVELKVYFSPSAGEATQKQPAFTMVFRVQ